MLFGLSLLTFGAIRAQAFDAAERMALLQRSGPPRTAWALKTKIWQNTQFLEDSPSNKAVETEDEGQVPTDAPDARVQEFASTQKQSISGCVDLRALCTKEGASTWLDQETPPAIEEPVLEPVLVTPKLAPPLTWTTEALTRAVRDFCPVTCDLAATCDAHVCPDGRVQLVVPDDWEVIACHAARCSDNQCCEQPVKEATCKDFTCDKGFVKFTEEACNAVSCSDGQCCKPEATCESFECGKGKNHFKTFTGGCNALTCSQEICCGQKVH